MEGWTWAQKAAAATALAAAASGFFYLTNAEEARRRRTDVRLRDCAFMVFALSSAVAWGALYVMDGSPPVQLPKAARRGGGGGGGDLYAGAAANIARGGCPF